MGTWVHGHVGAIGHRLNGFGPTRGRRGGALTSSSGSSSSSATVASSVCAAGWERPSRPTIGRSESWLRISSNCEHKCPRGWAIRTERQHGFVVASPSARRPSRGRQAVHLRRADATAVHRTKVRQTKLSPWRSEATAEARPCLLKMTSSKSIRFTHQEP
jgi:hypothetical protein